MLSTVKVWHNNVGKLVTTTNSRYCWQAYLLYSNVPVPVQYCTNIPGQHNYSRASSTVEALAIKMTFSTREGHACGCCPSLLVFIVVGWSVGWWVVYAKSTRTLSMGGLLTEPTLRSPLKRKTTMSFTARNVVRRLAHRNIDW